MQTLFHITTAEEAKAARESGTYEPLGFAREGFVHCSFREQVLATAARLFRGREDLVLLTIDPRAVGAEVRVENLEGGTEDFPHVYGRLPWTAVLAVQSFPCGPDGAFSWPDEG